jgi:hypothetical protein
MAETRTPPPGPPNAPAAAWQAQQAAELAEFTAQITGPNVHTQELGVPDGMLEDGGRS